MIHPSYSELIDAINTNSEDNDNTMLLNSRYSLVLATSKRARQIIAGSKPLVDHAEGKKTLSVAIDELYQGKVKILAGVPEEEASADETGIAEEVREEAEDDILEDTLEDTSEDTLEDTEEENTGIAE